MPPGRGPEVVPPGHLLLVLPPSPEGTRLRAFLAERGLAVTQVASDEAAHNVLDSQPIDLLVTPLRAARIQGLRLLALARDRNPAVGAVLIVSAGEEAAATAALDRGVVDFQVPPLNQEKLDATLRRILERQALLDALAEAERRLDERLGFPGLIGRSAAMAALRATLMELAPLDAHVLLWGEAGSGKDLVSGVLHRNSPRRNAPFLKIHCPALPPRLAREVLFGRARGRG
ncbi:MAG: response regulator, partial [Candidatus Eisenbacteria bacterium]|nr:response regulator [Candidatus Eisenbacteria bacterium]